MSNLIPVKVANDTEINREWKEVSESPFMFAKWLSRLFSVDATSIINASKVFLSASTPETNDGIWLKTSAPVAIGIPQSNGYEMIYQYPVNVPILWIEGETTLPAGFSIIPEDELEDYGLTAPTNENRFWSIFNPETVIQ